MNAFDAGDDRYLFLFNEQNKSSKFAPSESQSSYLPLMMISFEERM